MRRAGYGEVLAEAGLGRENLICPVFVSDRTEEALGSMQGVLATSCADVAKGIQPVADAGVPSIILFGIPSMRDAPGSLAADKNGVIQRAVKEIKSAFGRSINVITDVCLCQYNLSGHCGLLVNNNVDNDSTIAMLAKIAVSHADAGADTVAPSAMMDGQVRKIRQALDVAGHTARILSYSAKHSSSLYTPFRSAAFAKKGSSGIDKSSYQVSYANPRQAMREMEQDIIEGADMVMVKPGLAYLDLVRRAKERFSVPIAVQNVSGEYAMIKAAGKRGWIDEDEWKVSSLASMRRAGADRIISYFALQVAGYLD
ncbi:MAG: porphobilinogen synthase [Nitrososphaera sp.]